MTLNGRRVKCEYANRADSANNRPVATGCEQRKSGAGGIRPASGPRPSTFGLYAPIRAEDDDKPVAARQARLRRYSQEVSHAGTRRIVTFFKVRTEAEQPIPKATFVAGQRHGGIVAGHAAPGRLTPTALRISGTGRGLSGLSRVQNRGEGAVGRAFPSCSSRNLRPTARRGANMMTRRWTFRVFALVLTLGGSVYASAETIPTPARDWIQLTPVERRNWVAGFMIGRRTGTEETILVFMSHVIPHPKFGAAVKEAREKCLRELPSVVAEAVTQFYRDPANTYVEVWDAIDLSILSMRGQRIDDRLHEARRMGYEGFEKQRSQNKN